MVKPVVISGSEIWRVKEMDMKGLNIKKTKILRSMYESVAKQGIQGIRTNQKLRELYKDLDIEVDIENKTLEWIGHLVVEQGI